MKRKLIIEIELENDALAVEVFRPEHAKEIVRVCQFTGAAPTDHGKIMDINGNTAGSWRVEYDVTDAVRAAKGATYAPPLRSAPPQHGPSRKGVKP